MATRIFQAGLFALVLALATSAFTDDISDPLEFEHEKLRALKAIAEQAVSNNELDLLVPFLHPDFTVVTFTNSEFSDFELFKAQWEKSRKKFLQGGTYKVTLLPERSRLYGDWALALGDSTNEIVTGAGDEYTFTSRWTATFKKEGEDWLLNRLHYSIDPFQNPFVLAGAKKAVVKTAVIALLAGLLAGWVSFWGFRKLQKRGRTA